MYLWKCWRDTREVLAVSLLLIGALFVFVLRQNLVLDHHAPFERISTIFPVFLTLQAFPVSFVAWLLGYLRRWAGISVNGADRIYLPGREAAHTSSGVIGA